MRPGALLVLGLVASLGMLGFPPPWTEHVKSVVQGTLRPGQEAVYQLGRAVDWAMAWLAPHTELALRCARAEAERAKLEDQNARLAAALAEACTRLDPQTRSQHADEPLVVARFVPARVLGRQARDFLARRQILDVGSRSGIAQDDLVVDLRPVLIDRGRDARLEPKLLVLSAGRVWGRIAAVGPLTSTVQMVTDRGYRDLVRIGRPPEDDADKPAPQGILEGTGEPLPRIRLVEVTQPVAVGDPVYSAKAKGLISQPLLYGHLVRVERQRGAAYWELWMEPALAPAQPARVVVLRPELNPIRIATCRVREAR